MSRVPLLQLLLISNKLISFDRRAVSPFLLRRKIWLTQ
jgi:hypothetical protein